MDGSGRDFRDGVGWGGLYESVLGERSAGDCVAAQGGVADHGVVDHGGLRAWKSSVAVADHGVVGHGGRLTHARAGVGVDFRAWKSSVGVMPHSH